MALLHTLDFDSLASFDPFIKSISRQLLSNDGDEVDASDRLQNDVDRTMNFLFTFAIFTFLWCTLSCYIYSKPYDGPGGTGLVSCIRRTPFLKWFFQQPQKIQQQQQADDEISTADESEKEALTKPDTSTAGDTGIETKTNISDNVNNNKSDEMKSNETRSSSSSSPTISPPRKLIFGTENATLMFCCIGLLIAYLTWGFMQERIMGHPYGDPDDENNWFKYSSFCVFINRLFGLLVSTIVLKFFMKPSGNIAPPYVVSLCALSNMSSSWLQYEALHYVTFPVQTIFKSSKILITMAVGKFVLKKAFPLKKYLNAMVVALGVYIFLSAQKQANEEEKEDENDLGIYFYLGLALISGYAFCDAFTSNWQSRTFKATGISSLEMMQSVNAFTFVVSFCFSVSDLMDIYIFYVNHPLIMGHSLIMGLCAGFGQVLIFYTIQTFGPMKFATVMTTRMMCSVIISILYYGHNMTSKGIIGMLTTFAALYYQAFSKPKGPKSSNSNRAK